MRDAELNQESASELNILTRSEIERLRLGLVTTANIRRLAVNLSVKKCLVNSILPTDIQ